MQKDYVIITGLILGSAMIVVMLLVYFKTHKFAFGGAVLTVFGTILIGLSIWANIEVSIGVDGGLEARFLQLEGSIARTESKVQLNSVENRLVNMSLAYGHPIEFKKFDPVPTDLRTALEIPKQDSSFGILLNNEQKDQHYMQAIKFTDSGNYRIEYRAGASDKHYYSNVNKELLIQAFESYLLGTNAYLNIISWEMLEL